MERDSPKRTKIEETKGNPERSIPSVPEDVILHIFPSLPTKSLSKFRCVSKKWSSLISESKLLRQRALIMSLVGTQFSFHSIDQKTQVNSLDESFLSLFPTNFDSVKLLGSCNGLLLIGVDCDLFLWNPAINYCKKVLSCERLGISRYWVKSGLCYDPDDDDYKVLMGFSLTGPRSRIQLFFVGSLKTKTWREIELPYSFKSIRPGPVLRNCLHWWVSSKENARTAELNKIIYFDPTKNEFFDLPMPEPKNDEGNVLIGAGALDECICMARWVESTTYEGNVEVLVMKNYGVKESWEMLFRIERVGFCDHLVPLYYVDEEKSKVLVKVSMENKDYMVVYSINDASWTDVEIVNHKYFAIWYEESWIRPTEYGYSIDDDEYIEKRRCSDMLWRVSRKAGGSWETNELGPEIWLSD